MMGFFEKHHDKIELGAPSGCWLWSAARFGNGYGNVRVRGEARLAHREAYEDENGAGSADGLVVRHRCDTSLCVNPAHLEAGTQADNVRDMMERGRQAKGEAHGCSKLTEADVRTIRATYVRGRSAYGGRALAHRFGVSLDLIALIIRRKRWAHVS